MEVGVAREPGVARPPDGVAGPDAVADLDVGAAPRQVHVLPERAVAVVDDDEVVGEAAVLARLLDVGDGPGARGGHGVADLGVEVVRVAVGAARGVVRRGAVAEVDTVRRADGVGQHVVRGGRRGVGLLVAAGDLGRGLLGDGVVARGDQGQERGEEDETEHGGVGSTGRPNLYSGASPRRPGTGIGTSGPAESTMPSPLGPSASARR